MTVLERISESGIAAPERAAPDPMPPINALSPAPLAREEVHIRSMVLCTDLLCESDGARFSDSALEDIARRVVGVSVLCGHDRRSLPVARFFRAEITPLPVHNELTGRPANGVRAWFYWLAGTSGAEDLLRNIDGGIYRAVSISWRYSADRCSVCGAGRGGCTHVAGQRYAGAVCHRIIDHVDEVIEGSLVYKGADGSAVLAGEHARSGDACVAHVHWDRTWTRFCAAALAGLPRRSFTCRVEGPMSDETVELFSNLGWRMLAGEAPVDVVWHTLSRHASIPPPDEIILADGGRVILAGAGSRAPLAALPAGWRIASLESQRLWNRPWWVLHLEKEARS